VVIGLEREGGLLSRHETFVNRDIGTDTFENIERVVKFLLWARGGWRIHFGGPRHLDGCRIGFDLGASDYKVAAVKDGVRCTATSLPGTRRTRPIPAIISRN
jgi:hypothetical protein